MRDHKGSARAADGAKSQQTKTAQNKAFGSPDHLEASRAKRSFVIRRVKRCSLAG
jgi:hypothetical protein